VDLLRDNVNLELLRLGVDYDEVGLKLYRLSDRAGVVVRLLKKITARRPEALRSQQR
jgi:hypothetical protein